MVPRRKTLLECYLLLLCHSALSNFGINVFEVLIYRRLACFFLLGSLLHRRILTVWFDILVGLLVLRSSRITHASAHRLVDIACKRWNAFHVLKHLVLGVTEVRHFLIFISFLGLQGGASSVRNSAARDLKRLSQGSRSSCNILLEVDALHLASSFVVENKLVKSQVLEVALLPVASNLFALLLIELQSWVLFMKSLHNHGPEDCELVPQS